MARTYKRDSRGRFAGGGGGSSGGRGGRPKARMQERGRNRLTRDNAGKITGQGGSGATARGGRLKTAAGNQRGAVLMKAKSAGGRFRGGAGGVAKQMNPKPFVRTGKVVKIPKKKPPVPTKQDRAIEKVRNLKVATQIGGRAKQVFIPDKSLTPSRRKSLGLGSFSSTAESQRWFVSRQTLGSQSGVSISERSAYQSQLPKPKRGIIYRRR